MSPLVDRLIAPTVSVSEMHYDNIADEALNDWARDGPHRASVRRIRLVQVPWVDLAIIRRRPTWRIAPKDQSIAGHRAMHVNRAIEASLWRVQVSLVVLVMLTSHSVNMA